MKDLLHPALHHDRGHLELGLGHRGVDHPAAVALLGHLGGGGGEALLDLGAHLVGRREAHGLGQGVIHLGQNLLLHLLHGDGVGHRLAADLVGGVLGVGDVELHGVAGLGAIQRGGELRKDAIGAELDELVARARLLERLTVERAVDVGHHEVAHGGGAVLVLQARALLADAVELLLHGALGRLVRLAHDLQALVGAERGGGRHLQRDGEGHALLGGIAHVEIRGVDGVHTRGGQRLAVPVVERAVDGLGEQPLAAHALDDHACGHLARAEAG